MVSVTVRKQSPGTQRLCCIWENAVPVASRRVCASRALLVRGSVAVPRFELPDACGQITKKLSPIKSFQRELGQVHHLVYTLSRTGVCSRNVVLN